MPREEEARSMRRGGGGGGGRSVNGVLDPLYVQGREYKGREEQSGGGGHLGGLLPFITCQKVFLMVC